jgi:prepilin signal peptidase PulO-like enzyme (type II secretory pathway)
MFHNIFNPENWAVVPFHFWSLCFFVLGCIVGSFLNVCIYRMPRGQSVVSPPSHCPHCKYAIPFYLNVPLVTWLALRGRCKNCGAAISPRYFIVEFLTGAAFLSCWLAFGNQSPWLAIIFAIFLAGLICATFIDFEHFIIPDEITFGGIAAGLARLCCCRNCTAPVQSASESGAVFSARRSARELSMPFCGWENYCLAGRK